MAPDALYSPLWYRVSGLRPALRPHVEVHRHQYRGRVWFVLADRMAARHHRLPAEGWFLVGLMDGERTMDEVWQRALDELGDRAPTQDHAIRLLAQLHNADMLVCDVSPSTADLFRRYREERRTRWQQQARSPLAIRIPLVDPDRLLGLLNRIARPVFSFAGVAVWLLVVAAAASLALLYAADLRTEFVSNALQPSNLLLLWLLYPVIKALHELGHGLSVRRWGGEVHEMGVILLALVPMPYVDASAASAFRDKYRRMLVGAAGIMVELGIAALALLLWLVVEPGLVRSIAFNTVLIGGVSTLLFNGNPLLRFDGYYILADAIEIPNLAPRANRYISYLTMRYGFGLSDAVSPAQSRGESVWFVIYGIAAFIYRLLIVCAIAWILASRYPLLGGAVAIWAAGAYLLLPLFKGLRFVLNSPRIARQRIRALCACGGATLLLVLTVFVLPLPLATEVEGVVRLPEDARLRAGTDCFVAELLVQPGAQVDSGDALVRCEDPLLDARIALLRASVRELDARARALAPTDRTAAAVIGEQRTALALELAEAETRAAALLVRSTFAGEFLLADHRALEGRFFGQGQILGVVLDPARLDVRVIVPQTRMGLIRERLDGVALRFAETPGRAVSARVAREYPAAADRLPSRALGTSGGGRFAVDPRDGAGARTLETFYELDLEVLAAQHPGRIGGRVYARFEHGDEPLVWRLQRQVKRLFLRRVNG